jgi:shikimate kinase
MRCRGSARQLVLLGFMAAGKSTVGRLVADRLAWELLDLDALVVEAAGASIEELFRREGEAAFRARETEVLANAAGRPRTVLALGGGTAFLEENRRLLQGTDRVLIEISLETARRRLEGTRGRPLAVPAVLEERFSARMPVYRAFADLVVSADVASPEEVAERILRWREAHRSESE